MKKEIQQIQLIYKNYISVFFTIIICLTFSNKIIAQQWSNAINFDTVGVHNKVYIDTSHAHNIWQIGTPHKVLFNSANSLPNAIVTDTMGSYPINDTSSFILKITKPSPFPWSSFQWSPHAIGPTPFVSFMSKIDADSLLDGGYVEYSINNGINWLLVNTYDDFGSPQFLGSRFPYFTGTRNYWFQTDIILGDSNPDVGIETADSVLFKFTFVSDGINTNKEGWVIDDITYGTIEVEGISNIKENNNFYIYPNPVSDEFTIKITETGIISNELKIYNILGEMVYQTLIQNSKTLINISDLSSGMYFVKLISDKQIITKKIIKE